jgi:hypothetical protein
MGGCGKARPLRGFFVLVLVLDFTIRGREARAAPIAGNLWECAQRVGRRRPAAPQANGEEKGSGFRVQGSGFRVFVSGLNLRSLSVSEAG